MSDKLWSINDIKDAMREAGSHWWDPDTMRAFGCRIESPVYNGPGGIFFVTSEWDGMEGNKRAFSVRKFLPHHRNHGGPDLDTVGAMGDYDSRRAARAVAKSLASSNGTKGAIAEVQEVDERLHPVTILVQFLFDLDKHGKPRSSPTSAAHLMQKATLHRLYMEKLCSDERFCRQTREDGTHPLVQKTERKITELAAKVGATGVIFSGDPRGSTVKLTFADGFTNDFGKEGYCIPLPKGEKDD